MSELASNAACTLASRAAKKRAEVLVYDGHRDFTLHMVAREMDRVDVIAREIEIAIEAGDYTRAQQLADLLKLPEDAA